LSKETFSGYWTFPAGRIKSTDPSLEATAVREVKEETNLDFVPEKRFNFYESHGYGKRFISLIHLGTWTGEVKILRLEEVSQFGWFTYEETKTLDLAFAYREVIEDLHRLGLL